MYLFKVILLVFLEIGLGMELLGQMVVLFLVFEESSYCVPQWLYQFTFLPIVYKGTPLHPCHHVVYRLFEENQNTTLS